MDGENGGGIVNAEALRGYVSRVEHLHKERDALNADIRAIYAEAKDDGFDTTTLREIVREQRMDGDARTARYALLDAYRAALGMLADTPLGQAAEQTLWTEPPRAEDDRWPAPVPFAAQPLHQPKPRGRPRKVVASDDGDPIARVGDFRTL